MGRYGKYKAEYAKIAGVATELGATVPDLSIMFGVATSTVELWMTKHAKFSGAIKEARISADAKVERSLYERALGYSHEDTDIRTRAIGDGTSEIVQTPIIKHYPPSEVACIFWLKNRKPKEWRDKQELAVQNPDGSSLIMPIAIAIAQMRAKAK